MIDFMIYFGIYALAICIIFVLAALLADLFGWE